MQNELQHLITCIETVDQQIKEAVLAKDLFDAVERYQTLVNCLKKLINVGQAA